jgi:hypothetical protein
MNLEIRKYIETNHPEAIRYKYVFQYWINRSQLLEAYYQSKIGKQGLKSKLKKEGIQIKRMIAEEYPPDLGDFKSLAVSGIRRK